MQIPQHFHEFFTQFFLTIFLVKSKLSTAKKSKTITFSQVFHPKYRQFSREIKVEFLDKKWRFRTVCTDNEGKGKDPQKPFRVYRALALWPLYELSTYKTLMKALWGNLKRSDVHSAGRPEHLKCSLERQVQPWGHWLLSSNSPTTNEMKAEKARQWSNNFILKFLNELWPLF